MALDSKQLDELKKSIAAARTKAHFFGVCLGKTPEQSVFLCSKRRKAAQLELDAKKLGNTPKVASGMMKTEGSVINLYCEEELMPLEKAMKAWLRAQDLKFKVAILTMADLPLGDLDTGEDEMDAVTAEAAEEAEEEFDEKAEVFANDDDLDVLDPDVLQANIDKWKKLEAKFASQVAKAVAESLVRDTAALSKAWSEARRLGESGDIDGAIKAVAAIKATLEAERPDPARVANIEKWTELEAKFAVRVGKAVAEGTLEDADAVSRDWSAAKAAGAAGNLSEALKLLGRVKAALDAVPKESTGEPTGDNLSPEKTAEKDWTDFLALFEPQLAAAKSDGVDVAALEEALATARKAVSGKTPNHAGALKLTAPLQKKLDDAIAAHARLQADLKVLRDELAVVEKDLAVASLRDPGKAKLAQGVLDKIKVALEALTPAPARANLEGLQKLIAAVTKAWEAIRAPLLAAFQKLRPEAERLLAMKQDTDAAKALFRRMETQLGRLETALDKPDLTQAQTLLPEAEKTLAEYRLEEVNILKANAERAKAEVAYGKIKAVVVQARKMHALAAEFEADVKAFLDQDALVLRRFNDSDFPGVLANLLPLERFAKALVARKAEFDALKLKEESALDKRDKSIPIWTNARRVPLTTPAAKALFDETKTALDRLWEAYKTRDYALVESAFLTFDAAAKKLIAMKAACEAEVARRDKLVVDAKAEIVLFNAIKGPFVLPEASRLKAEMDALIGGFNAALAGGDLAALDLALAEVKAGNIRLAALAADNAEAIKRRDALAAEIQKLKPQAQAAINIQANTPAMNVAQKSVLAAYNELIARKNEGSDQGPVLLKALTDALKQVSDATADNAKAGPKAQKAAVKLDKKTLKRVAAMRKLAKANAPALDALLAELDTAATEHATLFNRGAFAEMTEHDKAFDGLLTRFKAATKAARPGTRKMQADAKARWTRQLRKDIEKVLKFDIVTPTMTDELTAIKQLGLDVAKHLKDGAWDAATKALDRLEPLVRDMLAFEPQIATIKGAEASFKAAWAKVYPKFKQGSGMEAVSPAVKLAIGDMKAALLPVQLANEAMRFADAEAALVPLDKALDDLIALKAEHDLVIAEKEACDQAYGTIAPKVDLANEYMPLNKVFAALIKTYDKAQGSFLAPYRAFDFAAARGRVPPYGVAAEALIAKDADYKIAEGEAATKSSVALGKLATASLADVKKLGADEKLELLADLRARKGALSDEEKKAQSLLYKAMDLDPAFKKVDEERRDKLTETIRGDDELMKAKTGWDKLDPDERVKMLKKTLAAECRIYNMPVPDVLTYSEASNTNGYFSPSSNTIHLNIHPSRSFKDFLGSVNLICHENAHNYQSYLVEKLNDGLLEPGDPEYKQAMMFAANSESGGYVKGQDDFDTYKKQPLEEHAHATGDGIGAMLMAKPKTK